MRHLLKQEIPALASNTSGGDLAEGGPREQNSLALIRCLQELLLVLLSKVFFVPGPGTLSSFLDGERTYISDLHQ